MAKSKLKTKETAVTPEKFISEIDNETRRDDAREVMKIMESVTGETPRMWGPSIIGFGKYHYKYESGTEGEMCRIGFSPRKNALTLYLMSGFDKYEELLPRLGKYTTSKACLYIKNLKDIDRNVLKDLIKISNDQMNKLYPPEK